MAETIFSKIVSGEIPSHKLIETDKVMAFLDINPMQRGHALVIPKGNYENIVELPDDVASEILVVSKKIVKAMQEVLKPEGFNFLQNNGEFSGQEVMHYHMHIIPRYKNDGESGARNMFGHFDTDNEALGQLAKDLKAKLVN